MIQYTPGFVPNKILIVGGGGTGSRLVPLLGQFLKTCAWIPNPEITIVDDDVVEEKNLLRQNFISIDVGKHKAQVLAERYSRAFNINITPMLSRITQYRDPYSISSTTEKEDERVQADLSRRYCNNAIVILAVDSPEARRHIIGRLMRARNVNPTNGADSILILDSGNENDFGQISLSTGRLLDAGMMSRRTKEWPNSIPLTLNVPAIPIDIPYYRDMKAESTVSCADLDQTMAINTMMAVTMFGIIQNFYYARPISFNRINVTLSHGATPQYLSPRFLIETFEQRQLDATFGHPDSYQAVQTVPFERELSVFENREYEPFRLQVRTAEAEQLRMQNEEARKQREKWENEAVAKAMKVNGWVEKSPLKLTPEEEAAIEAVKKTLADENKARSLKEETDAKFLKAAPKTPVKKAAARTAPVLEAYGLDDLDNM